jgi:hypothetical protein
MRPKAFSIAANPLSMVILYGCDRRVTGLVGAFRSGAVSLKWQFVTVRMLSRALRESPCLPSV